MNVFELFFKKTRQQTMVSPWTSSRTTCDHEVFPKKKNPFFSSCHERGVDKKY